MQRPQRPWLAGSALCATLGFLSLNALAFRADDDTRPADETATDAKTPARTWSASLGNLAPDFTLQNLAGDQITLSDLRGQTVVLEWFNPDCPVVKKAHGSGAPLESLGNRAHAMDDVTYLAINSGAPGGQGTGLDRNRRAKASMRLEHPVLLDEAGWVGRMYGANSTPHMFIIDPEGNLAYAGGHSDSRLQENYVAKALEEVRAGEEVSQPSTKNFGCSVKYSRKVGLGLSVNEVSLEDLDGNEHSLSDHRGQIVVLEWFNPSCPFVVKAHEAGGALEDAAARAAGHGVAWFAVNSAPDDHDTADEAKNRGAAEAWGMAHPILRDARGRTGKMFGASTTPHMFVLDQRGVLVYSGNHDEIDTVLAELLEGKPVSEPMTKSYGCGVKYAK